MHLLTQSALDIRWNIQKATAGPQSPVNDLLQLVYLVFSNRDMAQKAEYREICKRPVISHFSHVWRLPWRRAWQPTPVFLPGEFHGQRSRRATVHRVRKSHSWVLIPYWVSDSRTDIPNHHRKLFPKTLWKDRIQKEKIKQTKNSSYIWELKRIWHPYESLWMN